MYGTTLFVAAVALQAGANPVRLFERQASTSSVSATSSLSSLLTSVAIPTPTNSAPVAEPTFPSFPFPGSNGTYYICSFPSSNTTDPTTSLSATSAGATATGSVSILPEEVFTPSGVSTSSASPSATKPVPTTSFSGSVPTVTPTTLTVVGPSTTAIIECIPVPTGAHPHHPPPGSGSSVPPVPAPTVTSDTLTSSVPTSSPLSSTLI